MRRRRRFFLVCTTNFNHKNDQFGRGDFFTVNEREHFCFFALKRFHSRMRPVTDAEASNHLIFYNLNTGNSLSFFHERRFAYVISVQAIQVY